MSSTKIIIKNIVREQVSQNTSFVQPKPQKRFDRPADQCQIVRRVEMWYTSKDIGPFSTCMVHTNLKTRFENGISHLVFLARYYHTNRTKSLRRLRNLSNKHKLSDRSVKRVISCDCHVIVNKIFYSQ